MYTNIIDTGEDSYVECGSMESSLLTERDAMELVDKCKENETSLLMLHADSLSDEFLNVSTGLAEQTLRLFNEDQVKTAIVIPDDFKANGNFYEFVVESGTDDRLKIFDNRIDAERWLVGN
jgi:hypothetical protein